MVHYADRDQRKDKNRIENYRAPEGVLPVQRYAVSVFMKSIEKRVLRDWRLFERVFPCV